VRLPLDSPTLVVDDGLKTFTAPGDEIDPVLICVEKPDGSW